MKRKCPRVCTDSGSCDEPLAKSFRASFPAEQQRRESQTEPQDVSTSDCPMAAPSHSGARARESTDLPNRTVSHAKSHSDQLLHCRESISGSGHGATPASNTSSVFTSKHMHDGEKAFPHGSLNDSQNIQPPKSIDPMRSGVTAILQRCRAQQQRGDFAPGADAALRTIPALWRKQLVEWLQMICIKRQVISACSVAYAVSILDSYVAKCALADVPAVPATYQLCAVTAFTMACKFHERINVSAHLSYDFSRGKFAASEIAAMERRMMDVLGWRLYPVSVHDTATMFLQEISDILNTGQPVNPECPRGLPKKRPIVKRLEGITTVFLDLQLSTTQLLHHPRPAVALGTVVAACHICRVDFSGMFTPLMNDLFTPEEILLHESIATDCQKSFFDTFPDLVSRAPSPQSIVDVPCATNALPLESSHPTQARPNAMPMDTLVQS